MSLGNIQQLILQLTIDPHFAERFFEEPSVFQGEFGLSDLEMVQAAKLPKETITEFQGIVCSKRSRRVQDTIKRSVSYLPRAKSNEVFRSFAAAHVMRSNDWSQKISAFFDHLESSLGEDREELVIQELIAFERWMYHFENTEPEQLVGHGLVRSPEAEVRRFHVPVEPLLEDRVGRDLFKLMLEGHGREAGYVLAVRGEEDEVDLYEIDPAVFDILSRCKEPQSPESVLELIASALQEYGVEKQEEEVLAELIEFGVLIELGEEA